MEKEELNVRIAKSELFDTVSLINEDLPEAEKLHCNYNKQKKYELANSEYKIATTSTAIEMYRILEGILIKMTLDIRKENEESKEN